MLFFCHSRASSTAGISLRRALSRISSRTRLRFPRSLGLSSSQSAIQQATYPCLQRSALLLDLALGRILAGIACLAVRELADSPLEFRVAGPVRFQKTQRLF